MSPFKTFRPRIIVPLLAGIIGLAGCAHTSPEMSSGEAENEESVAVHVKNDHTAQATVHVRYEGGEVDRLGAVRSLDGATFELPAMSVRGRGVQLIAEMLAGRDYVTQELLLSAGSRVEFTIASPLHLSSIMVQ